jgi:hypothetical protein
MNATATRTSAAGGVGAATSTATTNGPSSGASTSGSGPVTAPANQAYLGEQTLPAPVGQPQTIHLPDGSMLVPVARVDSSGHRVPLSGGAGSAPLTGGGAKASEVASAHGGGGTMHAAEGTTVNGEGHAVQASGAKFEPLGFLYNDNYYKRYFDGGGIDVSSREKVEERAVESTFAYLKDREPDVDDFGVTGVQLRSVDPSADRDLLNVNPRAKFVIDVHGVQGNGSHRSIPTVMNEDGATFTDPRIGRG